MPHIDWKALPAGIRSHLEERMRSREITKQDLNQLMSWILTNPEVPGGPWCKDFGSFKLAGRGPLPSTFLTKEQPCFGQQI